MENRLLKPDSNFTNVRFYMYALMDRLLKKKKKHKKVLLRIKTKNRNFELEHIYQINTMEEYKKAIQDAENKNIIVSDAINSKMFFKDFEEKNGRFTIESELPIEDEYKHFLLIAKTI